MKWIATLSATWILAFAALLYANGEVAKTFRGEVADSQCALNIHSLTRSHREMLKSKQMGGTAASCSRYCVEHLGGNLVLSAGKYVYHLDKQEAFSKYVGQKVKVQGTLDQKTETIHVIEVEAEQ